MKCDGLFAQQLHWRTHASRDLTRFQVFISKSSTQEKESAVFERLGPSQGWLGLAPIPPKSWMYFCLEIRCCSANHWRNFFANKAQNYFLGFVFQGETEFSNPWIKSPFQILDPRLRWRVFQLRHGSMCHSGVFAPAVPHSKVVGNTCLSFWSLPWWLDAAFLRTTNPEIGWTSRKTNWSSFSVSTKQKLHLKELAGQTDSISAGATVPSPWVNISLEKPQVGYKIKIV